MKKIALLTILLTFLAGCGQSRIDDKRRLKGITKGQQVKNSLNRAKTKKQLQQLFSKILSPQW